MREGAVIRSVGGGAFVVAERYPRSIRTDRRGRGAVGGDNADPWE